MASGLTPSLALSKSVSASPQLAPPSQCQVPVISSHEGHPQRRSGGSGSFGSGASARTHTSVARIGQNLRKQHKGQRRPQLADEYAVAESTVIRSTSSRKGQKSITHLMNFTLPPRPPASQYNNPNRYSRKNPTWGLGSGHHAVDKARYVHANYRFVVDPRENYHAQAVDADIHLDWNNVLQILASAQSQAASCPICLSTPIAPRMAKCGHIFCLPCLIRYMHSTDDTNLQPEKKARWKKCPICWDSVYLLETRPVHWFVGQEAEPPKEGGDVVLRLMMRQAGSTLALPRDGAESLSANDDIPWYFAAEVSDYARVMKGSEGYMTLQFDREIEELLLQEKEDEMIFGEETTWTKKAISVISEAKAKVDGIGNPPSAPSKPEERNPKRPPAQITVSDFHTPEFLFVQHTAKSGQSMCIRPASTKASSNSAVLESIGPPYETRSRTTDQYTLPGSYFTSAASHHKSSRTSDSILASAQTHQARTPERLQHGDAPYFFYQALLHYYLSPLDIRILKAAFGDFTSFPTTILPRVERVSTGHIIDDDLRRRAKYLSHLPYGCEVGFLECNWVDVVPPEILHGFSNEIDRRRRKNTEKEVREEKERIRAEKSEDDKRWATARRKKSNQSREPSAVAESSSLADELEFVHNSSSVDLTAPSSSPPWLVSQHRNGSAFASLASPSTSPLAPRTVWGTTAVIPASPSLLPAMYEQDAADNDGWLQGWERDLLQEDQIISRSPAGTFLTEDSAQLRALGGNGKKKKAKKITLMTTNARRAA